MHCATSCCVQLQFPNARTQELAHADINSTQQVFFFSTCFLIFVDELNSHPRSRACFFSNSASKNGPHIFFPPHFVQNYSLHMPAVSPIILINFRYYLWRVSVGSGPSMVRPATNTKKHILAEKKTHSSNTNPTVLCTWTTQHSPFETNFHENTYIIYSYIKCSKA